MNFFLKIFKFLEKNNYSALSLERTKMSKSKELPNLKSIVICGNIGVGKTTLCRRLSAQIQNSHVIFEEFAENRYLPLYYEHIKKHGNVYNPYCLPSQMFFLNCKPMRKEIMAKMDKNSENPLTFVFDRGVLEDRYIFVQYQADQGLMSKEELEIYDKEFAKVYKEVFEMPDVVIYLKADVEIMQKRVKNRSRDMESDLPENN